MELAIAGNSKEKSTRTKTKKGFMDVYKHYDPTIEGYGNSSQWRENFRVRMGFDEAVTVLGKNSPLAILGLPEGIVDWILIKKTYRALAMKFHPDVCKDVDATERMKEINAAYTILEKKCGKH